jgi:hypothetical protein
VKPGRAVVNSLGACGEATALIKIFSIHKADIEALIPTRASSYGPPKAVIKVRIMFSR